MTKIRPLPGYVLIEPLDEDETTAGGLALPEKAKEKPMKGKVIKIGEELAYRDKQTNLLLSEPRPKVKEGNKVIFHRWSGQDVRDGNKEYKLVKFSDLMGVYD